MPQQLPFGTGPMPFLQYPRRPTTGHKSFVCTHEGCSSAYYFSHDLRRHERQKHGRQRKRKSPRSSSNSDQLGLCDDSLQTGSPPSAQGLRSERIESQPINQLEEASFLEEEDEEGQGQQNEDQSDRLALMQEGKPPMLASVLTQPRDNSQIQDSSLKVENPEDG